MNRSIFFSLILVIAGISAYAQQGVPLLGSTLIHVGDQAPEVSFETAPGKKTSFADYKGKIVFINFFATWCTPCVAEMPYLNQKIWTVYKDDPRFVFLVFGREHNWREVSEFKNKINATFPILPDKNKKVFRRFGVTGIPSNVILDENGKVIWASLGFGREEFEEMVLLLQQKLPPKETPAS